jgi:hypothetical protein
LRESTVFPDFVNFAKFRAPPPPLFLFAVNHFELALCVHFQDCAGAASDLELMIRRVFTPKGEKRAIETTASRKQYGDRNNLNPAGNIRG